MFVNLLFGTSVSLRPTSMTTSSVMRNTRMAYAMYCVIPKPVLPNSMRNAESNDA